MTTVTVKTPKGNQYEYTPYPISTNFNSVAGNYMFGYQQANGSWYILYVGQTNNLGSRFSNHEKLPLAKRDGATHILAHKNSSEQARLNEEAELIAWLQPKHNQKLK